MIKRTLHHAAPVVAWAALTVACGSPPISKELRTARDAYAEAEAGVASDLAPAELAEAKQGLERAEEAFRADHKSQETKDYAYIAERRAQLATIYGQIEQRKREKKDLEIKLERLEKKYANMTAEELTQAQDALAAKKRELERERENLNKTAAQLEQEREMRQSVEKKLTAAISSLDQIGKVKEENRGVVITLSGSVLFATGKYELLPIAKEKLNDVAKALQDQGFKEIIVEGHTDSRGAETTNQELSLNRAQSVRTHLVSQGIDTAKISARGMGEASPVAPNTTTEGRANNRRVELVVVPE